MSVFGNKYLIFLLAFFSPMIINIGGEISPSFLFILFSFPFWKKYLPTKNDRNFWYIIHLFEILLCVQILWIPFSDTDLINQIKGILVVISGMLFFMYYYIVYIHNQEPLKWAVLGTFISSFVFIDVLVEMEGSDFGMWKFQIMPRLVSLCALINLWGANNAKIQHLSPLLFIFIGGLGVATGARSTGLTPFIAGLLMYVLQFRKNIKVKQIKKYIFSIFLLGYAFFAVVYVPNVMNGNINAGNSEQIKELENPYNPLNLLMLGRSTSIVPFLAFLDKPLTGWGYMAQDPNGYYRFLAHKLMTPDEVLASLSSEKATIPRHSGWGDLSCSYGIIGFLSIFLILKRCFSILFKSFVVRDKYLLYRIFIALSFLWNILFSPLSHFKYETMYIAIIMAISLIELKKYKYEGNTSSDSDVRK